MQLLELGEYDIASILHHGQTFNPCNTYGHFNSLPEKYLFLPNQPAFFYFVDEFVFFSTIINAIA